MSDGHEEDVEAHIPKKEEGELAREGHRASKEKEGIGAIVEASQESYQASCGAEAKASREITRRDPKKARLGAENRPGEDREGGSSPGAGAPERATQDAAPRDLAETLHRRQIRPEAPSHCGRVGIELYARVLSSACGREEHPEMDLNPLFALITGHRWVAAFALIIGAVVRLLKSDTPLPFSVPARWRSWLALALGAVAGVLDAVVAGTPVRDAVLQGLVSAALAMVGHDTVIESLRGGREFFAKATTSK